MVRSWRQCTLLGVLAQVSSRVASKCTKARINASSTITLGACRSKLVTQARRTERQIYKARCALVLRVALTLTKPHSYEEIS